MLKLSIVIPTLKEEGYIKDTVLQFKQLVIPHEVIVADGGSADRTVEIAKTVADHVTQLVIPPGTKTAPSHGRNAGAKLATGEFLAFVDSSVRIPDINNFFARALAKFDVDPELVGITGPQNVSLELETWADRFFLNCQNLAMRIQNNVLHRGAGTGKFMFMRRDAFERIHGFREDLVAGEDLDLVLRLSRIGKTRYMSDMQIYYPGRREHGLGWIRLIWVWTINVWWIWLFDKAYNKEWKPVR